MRFYIFLAFLCLVNSITVKPIIRNKVISAQSYSLDSWEHCDSIFSPEYYKILSRVAIVEYLDEEAYKNKSIGISYIPIGRWSVINKWETFSLDCIEGSCYIYTYNPTDISILVFQEFINQDITGLIKSAIINITILFSLIIIFLSI